MPARTESLPVLSIGPAPELQPPAEYTAANAIPCIRADELTVAGMGVIIRCTNPLGCGTRDYCQNTLQACYYDQRSK